MRAHNAIAERATQQTADREERSDGAVLDRVEAETGAERGIAVVRGGVAGEAVDRVVELGKVVAVCGLEEGKEEREERIVGTESEYVEYVQYHDEIHAQPTALVTCDEGMARMKSQECDADETSVVDRLCDRR